MAIQVTKAVAEGLEAVRSEGKYNMFDRQGALNELIMNGYDEAAQWVEENPKLWGKLVFEGLEVIQEEPKAAAAPQAGASVESQPAFKVGDRVRVKGSGTEGVIEAWHNSGQSWQIATKRHNDFGDSYTYYLYRRAEDLERITAASQPTPAGEVDNPRLTSKIFNEQTLKLHAAVNVIESGKEYIAELEARIEALEADKRALVEAFLDIKTRALGISLLASNRGSLRVIEESADTIFNLIQSLQALAAAKGEQS